MPLVSISGLHRCFCQAAALADDLSNGCPGLRQGCAAVAKRKMFKVFLSPEG